MDQNPEGQGRGINVMETLRAAISDLRHMERRHERERHCLDELQMKLFQVECAILRGSVPLVSAPAPGRSKVQPVSVHFELVRGDRNATIVLDGGKKVAVPETLAGLAAILASREGEANDGLAGWKRFELIAGLLETRFGRPFSNHSISNLLSRLRKRFADAGADRWLIESDPVRGARLRVKSVGAQVFISAIEEKA